MPRHRSRQNATHELTATRAVDEIPCDSDADCPPGTSCGPDGVCVGGYGNPVSGEITALENERVRYDPAGTSYQRDDTGALMQRSPTASGRGELAESLEEGDDITLTPLDTNAETLKNLEVRGIEAKYSPRFVRAQRAVIELGGV